MFTWEVEHPRQLVSTWIVPDLARIFCSADKKIAYISMHYSLLLCCQMYSFSISHHCLFPNCLSFYNLYILYRKPKVEIAKIFHFHLLTRKPMLLLFNKIIAIYDHLETLAGKRIYHGSLVIWVSSLESLVNVLSIESPKFSSDLNMHARHICLGTYMSPSPYIHSCRLMYRH